MTERETSTATEQARQQAQAAAGNAKQQAEKAGDQAQARAKQELDTRSTQAAERVSSVSGVMRDAGGDLRSQGNDFPAQIVQTVAEKADELAGYLRESNGDQILRDVQEFGRRQPLTVALLGLAAGVAAARFVKASSPESGLGHGTAAGNARVPRSEAMTPAAATGYPAEAPTAVPAGPRTYPEGTV